MGCGKSTIANRLSKITKIPTVDLDKIDSGTEKLLSTLAEVGARTNRVEAVENRLKDSTLILKSMLSTLEDVDYAEAIIEAEKKRLAALPTTKTVKRKKSP